MLKTDIDFTSHPSLVAQTMHCALLLQPCGVSHLATAYEALFAVYSGLL